MRREWLLPILLLLSIPLHAQVVKLEVEIEDAFQRTPLSGVKLSVLNPDSTVVVDSMEVVSVIGRKGPTVQKIYTTLLKSEERDYLLHASRSGYGDVWQRFSVPSGKAKTLELPPLLMRRVMEKDLSEVVVTATKVKMYYKGDTLVYNADAFNLPDGSMLDALIRQLPGVSMNARGEIFVNGRKVEELLLGSRSFMRGNKEVLMENLPYYTVKDIKVYEKQSDRSAALGYDVESRKYVMDVNLKPEYSLGYIANMEAATGTEKRWMGRGFLLGFSDRWRTSLMGNVNNVNESRYIGEQGYWSPSSVAQSLSTTRSVATDLDYESKDKNTKNNFTADFTSRDDDRQTRQWREQFLESGNPTSLSEGFNRSGRWSLKISNEVKLLKPSYFEFKTQFDYEKRDALSGSQFEQWGDELAATSRNNGISEGRKWSLEQTFGGAFNISREKQLHVSYGGYLRHTDDQSWLSSRYDTWQAGTESSSVRHNANDVRERGTWLLLDARHANHQLVKNMEFHVGNKFTYSNIQSHDYLYHPDTLLLASQLDLLSAITDPSNSYDSHSRYWCDTPRLVWSLKKSYRPNSFMEVMYDRWSLEVNAPVIHQSLDYKRAAIDTLVSETRVYVSPKAFFRHVSPDGKQRVSVSAAHECAPAGLLSRISYRDDSHPLVIMLGNPDLKGTASSKASAEYTNNAGSRQRLLNLGTTFTYRHRDVAQSKSYNPQTGVYTYKPMNVSGAYLADARFGFSRALGKKEYWSWKADADVGYNHSVDHSMLDGETESRPNAVNTTTVHDRLNLQYGRESLTVSVFGDIRWRHSEGKMRDFGTLNATDLNYGITARYTIPGWKTTVSADGTMYSRRGYGSSSLNTDDFVLNASLSQPLFKGRLIARIEAYDLLHQLSSVTYEVNAQGRTETWYRSLPHYVMFHLVYHWNKNPKKS